MALLIAGFIFVWDGRDIFQIKPAPPAMVDSLVSSMNLTYSSLSFPMMVELRDSLYRINETAPGPYRNLQTSIDLSQTIERIGKEKLIDLELAALLYQIAGRQLNPNLYCISKLDPLTGDIYPFDLTPLYGVFTYGCYPILTLDDTYILSPRQFSTTALLLDIVRFPQPIFEADAPQLLHQLRGYRAVFVKSIEGDKEPSPQDFEVLK